MRRTTSALTTAVLGAVLTASIVAAQQPPAPDNGPQAQSPAAAPLAAPATATAAGSSQLYGMSATRGARYLLRNGLDYLSYQEYDRSLKFLREAESRQKELTDAEKLALKQGIESAQRGLRNATDAEAPYAISDRARPRNGFAPAKPEERVAAVPNQVSPWKRQAKTTQPAETNLLESDSDDRGEPIRLASSEAPISGPISETNASPRSTSSGSSSTTASPAVDQPRNMPEIPEIPTVSQLPDLTEANGSERPVAVAERSAPDQKPAKAPISAVAGRVAAPATQPAVEEQAPGPVPQVANPDAAATADLEAQADRQSIAAVVPANENKQTTEAEVLPSSTPLGGPVVNAPTNTERQQQSLLERVSADNLPTSHALAPAQPADPQVTPATTSAPADSKPAPEATTDTAAIDPKTKPTAATVEDSTQLVDPGALVHQETEVAVPASTAGPVQDRSSTQPTTSAEPMPASPVVGDELPPLPADLGNPATATHSADGIAPQPTNVAPARPGSASDNELPPLPADLGRSVPTNPASETPPAQTISPPASTSAKAGNVNEQPGQTVEPAAAHTEQESLTPTPVGSEAQSVPATPDAGAHTATAGVAPTLSAGSPATSAGLESEGAVVTDPTHAELPPLPGSNAPSTPVSQPYPSTNPNLEPQQPAPPTTAAVTAADSSSLPPPIVDHPVASGTDLFIPVRPMPPSTLRPDLMREVEKIARNQEDELRRQLQNPQQPAAAPRDTMASDLRTQTQLDISRAPSPAEARPIKAIPVPEDWVPLSPRNWTPQRKYWAAAATCHLPLYFQDPVLERYGHSVEQFVGPIGRFLTYPVDDPTQSTQRNQILQPFFSAGLMGLQIIAWPYNLIMDPPWEAQYDLGYYRPGDNIPIDTYWLPLHGYGPPLRGSNY